MNAFVENSPLIQADSFGLDPGGTHIGNPPKPSTPSTPAPSTQSSIGLYVCCRSINVQPTDDCLTRKCGKFFRHCDISSKCASGEESFPIEPSGKGSMDNGTPCSKATAADIQACLKRNPYDPLDGVWGSNCQTNT